MSELYRNPPPKPKTDVPTEAQQGIPLFDSGVTLDAADKVIDLATYGNPIAGYLAKKLVPTPSNTETAAATTIGAADTLTFRQLPKLGAALTSGFAEPGPYRSSSDVFRDEEASFRNAMDLMKERNPTATGVGEFVGYAGGGPRTMSELMFAATSRKALGHGMSKAGGLGARVVGQGVAGTAILTTEDLLAGRGFERIQDNTVYGFLGGAGGQALFGEFAPFLANVYNSKKSGQTMLSALTNRMGVKKEGLLADLAKGKNYAQVSPETRAKVLDIVSGAKFKSTEVGERYVADLYKVIDGNLDEATERMLTNLAKIDADIANGDTANMMSTGKKIASSIYDTFKRENEYLKLSYGTVNRALTAPFKGQNLPNTDIGGAERALLKILTDEGGAPIKQFDIDQLLGVRGQLSEMLMPGGKIPNSTTGVTATTRKLLTESMENVTKMIDEATMNYPLVRQAYAEPAAIAKAEVLGSRAFSGKYLPTEVKDPDLAALVNAEESVKNWFKNATGPEQASYKMGFAKALDASIKGKAIKPALTSLFGDLADEATTKAGNIAVLRATLGDEIADTLITVAKSDIPEREAYNLIKRALEAKEGNLLVPGLGLDIAKVAALSASPGGGIGTPYGTAAGYKIATSGKLPNESEQLLQFMTAQGAEAGGLLESIAKKAAGMPSKAMGGLGVSPRGVPEGESTKPVDSISNYLGSIMPGR